MTERYKAFPPRWAHVRVPTSSPAAALAGLTLYAPCRPLGLAVRRLAWTAVRLGGPRMLPGAARAWQPPLDPASWETLKARWREAAGDFDAMAVYQQPQLTRHGVAVLLLAGGRPTGFVKLRATPEQRLPLEQQVLRALDPSPRTFWTPTPLDVGDLDGWRYLVTTALPARIDRPPSAPDLAAVSRDLQGALQDVLPAGDVPDHWAPMHGDLTPWNLREVPGVGLVLLDWEDAGWGPPFADEVLYRAAEAALARGPVHQGPPEAVAYWRERVAARPATEADRSFHDRLAAVLDAMAAR